MQANRPKMKTVFHADLSDAHAGEDYWVHACGKRYPLVPHTAETRARTKAASPRLAAVPDARLTHFTLDAADLPADRVVRVHIKHTLKTFPNAKGNAGVGNVAIHIPPPGVLKGEHAQESSAFHTQIDYVSTAKALVFHHADLINNDCTVATRIHDYMDNVQAISDMFDTLGQQMREMGPPTENFGWATLVPYTPPASDLKGCDGKTTYYMSQPTDDIMTAAGPVMTAMMIATKNDMFLSKFPVQYTDDGTTTIKGVGNKWMLQPGTAVESPTSPPGMELAMRVQALGDGTWQTALASANTANGLYSQIKVLDPNKRQIQLTMNNIYIRYLGAYIQFFDASGNAMSTPTWKPDDAGLVYDAITLLDVQYDNLRFLGYMQPVNNVMAIPIVADPGVLQVTITFPPGAVSAAIYGSGLGTGSDLWPKTPLVGGLMTGLMNLGIPAFMLGFGATSQSYLPLYKLLNEMMESKAVVGVVIGLGTAYFGAQFGVSAYNKQMNWHAFSTLAQLLFNQAMTKLLLWVEAETAGEAAADEIPFAGWLVLAINIATGVAQIAETIVEVATSPWNIPNSISTSITTNVTLHPDPRDKAFPQPQPGQTASYTVKMIYQNQTRPTVAVESNVPAGSTATTLPATFPNNTLGGQVKLEADYHIGSWLAGKATTGFMDNNEADVTQVDLYLVGNVPPLTSQSIYKHSSLLTYQNNAYVWQPTATAPTATIANTNTSSTGNAISVWSGLTLSQRYGMLGLAWKAAGMGITSCASGQGGQLFAMQNINIPGAPMNAVEFPVCGLDGQTMLVYDFYPPKFQMTNGQWVIVNGLPVPDPNYPSLGEYWVDPRKAANDPTQDGGYHLRKITLNPPTPFNTGSNLLSYGRFPYQPDSMALHPSGHAIAVSAQYSKIMVTQLVPDGTNDSDLPLAKVYAGVAQVTGRPGLLFHPVAVSCAYDGTIFVLEDTKSSNSSSSMIVARVQAFDLNGNPVNRFFDDNGQPSAFLYLADGSDNTYLDIAAIGDLTMTYLYVLYYSGNGSVASDYHMAVYQYGSSAPAINPLVTTDNVAGAKLVVNMWHTAYVLNYDMVTDGQGHYAGPKNATTGPAGRTVPSVSEWLPPVS